MRRGRLTRGRRREQPARAQGAAVQLRVRTSAGGREYLSGWTGSAKLLGFKDTERDEQGCEVWSIYAVTPTPRGDQAAGAGG
jgi:hypothetical protein